MILCGNSQNQHSYFSHFHSLMSHISRNYFYHRKKNLSLPDFFQQLLFSYDLQPLVNDLLNGLDPDLLSCASCYRYHIHCPTNAEKYAATPLIIATIIDNKKAANLLLEFGANIKFSNYTGITPLKVAVSNWNTKLVCYFIRHNSDGEIHLCVTQTI